MTGVVGLLLVGIAIAIVYAVGADHSFGSIAAAAVIGWLGIDALLSAARKRRSILAHRTAASKGAQRCSAAEDFGQSNKARLPPQEESVSRCPPESLRHPERNSA